MESDESAPAWRPSTALPPLHNASLSPAQHYTPRYPQSSATPPPPPPTADTSYPTRSSSFPTQDAFTAPPPTAHATTSLNHLLSPPHPATSQLSPHLLMQLGALTLEQLQWAKLFFDAYTFVHRHSPRPSRGGGSDAAAAFPALMRARMLREQHTQEENEMAESDEEAESSWVRRSPTSGDAAGGLPRTALPPRPISLRAFQAARRAGQCARKDGNNENENENGECGGLRGAEVWVRESTETTGTNADASMRDGNNEANNMSSMPFDDSTPCASYTASIPWQAPPQPQQRLLLVSSSSSVSSSQSPSCTHVRATCSSQSPPLVSCLPRSTQARVSVARPLTSITTAGSALSRQDDWLREREKEQRHARRVWWRRRAEVFELPTRRGTQGRLSYVTSGSQRDSVHYRSESAGLWLSPSCAERRVYGDAMDMCIVAHTMAQMKQWRRLCAMVHAEERTQTKGNADEDDEDGDLNAEDTNDCDEKVLYSHATRHGSRRTGSKGHAMRERRRGNASSRPPCMSSALKPTSDAACDLELAESSDGVTLEYWVHFVMRPILRLGRQRHRCGGDVHAHVELPQRCNAVTGNSALPDRHGSNSARAGRKLPSMLSTAAMTAAVLSMAAPQSSTDSQVHDKAVGSSVSRSGDNSLSCVARHAPCMNRVNHTNRPNHGTTDDNHSSNTIDHNNNSRTQSDETDTEPDVEQWRGIFNALSWRDNNRVTWDEFSRGVLLLSSQAEKLGTLASAKQTPTPTQTQTQRQQRLVDSPMHFAAAPIQRSAWQARYPLVHHLFHRTAITHMVVCARAMRSMATRTVQSENAMGEPVQRSDCPERRQRDDGSAANRNNVTYTGDTRDDHTPHQSGSDAVHSHHPLGQHTYTQTTNLPNAEVSPMSHSIPAGPSGVVYFTASASDGWVKMWHSDTNPLDSAGCPASMVHERHVLSAGGIITAMVLGGAGLGDAPVVAVSATDGTVTLLRTSSGERVRTLRGMWQNSAEKGVCDRERRGRPHTDSSHLSTNDRSNGGHQEKENDRLGQKDDDGEGAMEANRLYGAQAHESTWAERVAHGCLDTEHGATTESNKRATDTPKLSAVPSRASVRASVCATADVAARTRATAALQRPYTIRAYRADANEIFFGSSHRYFCGLDVVAPTFEHLARREWVTCDTLCQFGYDGDTSTRMANTITHRSPSSTKSSVATSSSVGRGEDATPCKDDWADVHDTSHRITPGNTSKHTPSHLYTAQRRTAQAMYATALALECMRVPNRHPHDTAALQRICALLLGYDNGLVQLYALPDGWFSRSQAADTRRLPPLALQPVWGAAGGVCIVVRRCWRCPCVEPIISSLVWRSMAVWRCGHLCRRGRWWCMHLGGDVLFRPIHERCEWMDGPQLAVRRDEDE